MTVLAIDPGIRGCGCSIFVDGRLIIAEYVKNPLVKEHGPREAASMAQAVYDWVSCRVINVLVLEMPQIYSRGGTKTKGDPNLLLPLAGVDGALAALFPSAEVHWYLPREWKGQTSKPKSSAETYVIEKRVRMRLDEKELACIVWPNAVKFTFDVSDSIGIGMHFLGRFERKRVYARE